MADDFWKHGELLWRDICTSIAEVASFELEVVVNSEDDPTLPAEERIFEHDDPRLEALSTGVTFVRDDAVFAQAMASLRTVSLTQKEEFRRRVFRGIGAAERRATAAAIPHPPGLDAADLRSLEDWPDSLRTRGRNAMVASLVAGVVALAEYRLTSIPIFDLKMEAQWIWIAVAGLVLFQLVMFFLAWNRHNARFNLNIEQAEAIKVERRERVRELDFILENCPVFSARPNALRGWIAAARHHIAIREAVHSSARFEHFFRTGLPILLSVTALITLALSWNSDMPRAPVEIVQMEVVNMNEALGPILAELEELRSDVTSLQQAAIAESETTHTAPPEPASTSEHQK